MARIVGCRKSNLNVKKTSKVQRDLILSRRNIQDQISYFKIKKILSMKNCLIAHPKKRKKKKKSKFNYLRKIKLLKNLDTKVKPILIIKIIIH